LNEKKIGTYLCNGCSIGDSLDLDALSKMANDEYKVSLCKTHNALCHKEGIDLIKSDIKENDLNAVVIAACSARVNQDVFTFNPNIFLERVNIREHVAWCQEPKHEDTQMMAEDYLRMGIVKTQKIGHPEPFIGENMTTDILVVGGGVSGLTAALDAAKFGRNVVLVEKEDQLGGRVKKMHRQYPKNWPYDQLQYTNIDDLIQDVNNQENLTIRTSTTIEKIEGQPGLFDVTLKNSNGENQLKIGSIIQATGWRPYEPSNIEHLSYGQHPNIINNVQMEELVAEGGEEGEGIIAPDGNKPQNIVFIQCAGQHNDNHLSYCSSVCCMVGLKQAIYCRQQNPDANVYIIYRHLRTPGHFEEFYKWAQDDERTFLTKGEVSKVEVSENGIIVNAEKTLLGDNISISADMVVLATGMVPSTHQNNILNLTYRLGKDLPDLKHGFVDSHFVCFPYETRRTGIYAAGCVRSPMNIAEAKTDASGAALKAIHAGDLLQRGEADFPRLGDQSFADFTLKRCTQCKRCTEDCPFGSLDEDEKGTPQPNPNRCRRCGICMGSCPERIISFSDYSIDMLSSMVKSINIPDEFEEKPRILAFICENDSYPAIDLAGIHRLKYSPLIRVIPVRCIGSVNNVYIADALSSGFDGILLIGCQHGDDYQCHFIKGSELIQTRQEKLQETLTRLVLEPERIKAFQLAINEYDQIAKIFNDYAQEIEDMGLNPFKGM